MISDIHCNIRAYSGIEHCLLTETNGDMFSIAVRRGAYSGALPQLFPFPRGSLFAGPILSLPEALFSTCLRKGRSTRLMTVRAKKAALFFLVCDANTVTRLSIPAAMRAKRYLDVEASNQTLQMQVCRKSHKIKATNTPCPESVAASSLLTLATAATAARPELRTITPNSVSRLLVRGQGHPTMGSVRTSVRLGRDPITYPTAQLFGS